MAMAQTAFRARPALNRHSTAAARRSQRAEMPLFQAFLRPSSAKVTDGLCIKDATTIEPACGSGTLILGAIWVMQKQKFDFQHKSFSWHRTSTSAAFGWHISNSVCMGFLQ